MHLHAWLPEAVKWTATTAPRLHSVVDTILCKASTLSCAASLPGPMPYQARSRPDHPARACVWGPVMPE